METDRRLATSCSSQGAQLISIPQHWWIDSHDLFWIETHPDFNLCHALWPQKVHRILTSVSQSKTKQTCGLQNLSGLKLFPKKKKGCRCKYLIFTAVKHRVTVLFGQVFVFIFLFLVRSWKSHFYWNSIIPPRIPLSDQNIRQHIFFSIFHDPLNTVWIAFSVCNMFFFCVSEHMLWLFWSSAIKRYHTYELWMDC